MFSGKGPLIRLVLTVAVAHVHTYISIIYIYIHIYAEYKDMHPVIS